MRGWGSNPYDDEGDLKPTGYWLVWQDGLRGSPPRYKAKNETEARKKYKREYGYEPDFCEEEIG